MSTNEPTSTRRVTLIMRDESSYNAESWCLEVPAGTSPYEMSAAAVLAWLTDCLEREAETGEESWQVETWTRWRDEIESTRDLGVLDDSWDVIGVVDGWVTLL
ncbi:MAG: hypothetical protein AB7T37_13950 [Dehalococcoidia bacterium]